MALLVTETAAYAPEWLGLSRPMTSTSTFWSTATMESETEATTRSSATARRAPRWSSKTGSGRTAATHPVAQGRGKRPPDQARTASKRACPAANTSPMRMPTAAPEAP